MGDQDRRALACGREEPTEDLGFPSHVELRCWFVEQHDSGTLTDGAQRTRQRDALPLTPRQVGAPRVGLRQDRVEVGQSLGAGIDKCGDDIGVIGAGGRDVVAKRQFEPDEVLEDRRDP